MTDIPPRGTDSREHSHLGGDNRVIGPTTDELLGQRAGPRPTNTIDGSIDTTGDGPVPVPELPDLASDVYLLEPEATSRRARRSAVMGPLQGLALDHALGEGGDLVWIDVQAHATTQALLGVAPSRRALERVHVARAFTTHQHQTLIDLVRGWLDGTTESPFGSPETERPAILVCPALDALYRAGEVGRSEAQSMLTHAVAVLQRVAREHDIPVIATRTSTDDFSAVVERAATTIALRDTGHGARFECPELDFETLAYDVGRGLVQTTLAFWADLLSTRHPTVVSSDDPTLSTSPVNGPSPQL